MANDASGDRGAEPVSVPRQAVRVSDLSVSGFAVGSGIGVHALRPVTGSSMLTLGPGPHRTAVGQPGAVRVANAVPWNRSRQRALERLSDAAQGCGADAVIDVRIHERPDVSIEGAVATVATGTAVRQTRSVIAASAAGERPAHRLMGLVPRRRSRERVPPGPVLSVLSAQDHARLARAGYLVRGMVTVTMVVTCVPTFVTRREQHLRRLTPQGRGNREREEMSRTVVVAHARAVEKLRDQAAALDAEDVIAIGFEREQRHVPVSLSAAGRGVMLIVHATGTAIARSPVPTGSAIATLPIVTLR